MSAGAHQAPLLRTLQRGWRLRCPGCGKRGLFRAYLKLNSSCPACGADFSRTETADVAPYITVMLIGMVVMPTTLLLVLHAGARAEALLPPSLALAFVVTLVLLPRVKGALAALLWRAQREI